MQLELWDPAGCQRCSGDIPIPACGPPFLAPGKSQPWLSDFEDLSFLGDFPALGNLLLAEPALRLPPAAPPRCPGLAGPAGDALLRHPGALGWNSLAVPRPAQPSPRDTPWGGGCRGAPAHPSPQDAPRGRTTSASTSSYFNADHLKYCNYGNGCR